MILNKYLLIDVDIDFLADFTPIIKYFSIFSTVVSPSERIDI